MQTLAGQRHRLSRRCATCSEGLGFRIQRTMDQRQRLSPLCEEYINNAIFDRKWDGQGSVSLSLLSMSLSLSLSLSPFLPASLPPAIPPPSPPASLSHSTYLPLSITNQHLLTTPLPSSPSLHLCHHLSQSVTCPLETDRGTEEDSSSSRTKTRCQDNERELTWHRCKPNHP